MERAQVRFADPSQARRALLLMVPAVLAFTILVRALPETRLGLGRVSQRIRFFSYDLAHQLRARLVRIGLLGRPPAEQVAVVAVDEEALARVGRWPWPRQRQAELLRAIQAQGARAIALDYLTSERAPGPAGELRELLAEAPPEAAARYAELREALHAGGATLDAGPLAWLEHPEGADAALAASLREAGPVVLGAAFLDGDHEVDWGDPAPGNPPPEEWARWLEGRGSADPQGLWESGFFPTRLLGPGGPVPVAGVRVDDGPPLDRKDPRQAARLRGLELPGGAVRARGLALPRPFLLAAAGRVGFVNDEATQDGVVRAFAVARTLQGYPLPSLAFAGVAAALGGRAQVVLDSEFLPRALRVAGGERDLEVPCGVDGRLWYDPYPPGPLGPPVFSAARVLVPGAQVPELRDRLVFVGTTATGLTDIRFDPLGRFRPGVQAQATMASTIFQARPLLAGTASWLTTLGLTGVLMLLLALALPRLEPAGSLGLLLATQGLCLAAGVLALHAGVVLVPAEAAGPLLLYYPLALLYLHRAENREKAWIDQMFKRYVSPDYVEELKRNKGQLDLGGREAEITAFFSDLRGFSSFSEHFEAGRLFAFLGEYLGEMAGILDRHGGTLDKFEGDAVVAFFGAPVPQQDHALRACRAGLDMLARLEELDRSWREEGRWPELQALAEAEGAWQPVRMRIGLNTGTCAIGHLGTAERGNYTMMGDEVNLAARLEGAGKAYQVGFTVSEAVRDAVQGEIRCRELDRIRVVGRRRPVRIFEVLARHEDLSPDEQADLEAWEAAQTQLAARDFAAAAEAFATLAARRPEDAPATLWAERAAALAEAPPPEDWDGVTDLESK